MRGKDSQPTHAELFTAIKAICSNAIAEVEDGLGKQRDANQAAARRIAEEKRQKEEEVRLAAARKEKARQEEAWQLEQEQLDILAVERSLAAKRQALRDKEKASGNGGDSTIDDDDDNEGSEFTPDDQPVSFVSECS
jgi:hypothetical protein